ncbi:2-C-methyl-D-erythritol 2,4-cyclodiphosphate synthase, partial [Paracoccus sp. S4493]|uniref:IspD/TarI family cytidylyltransferase n=1 Tax=Paracoccus sp. S4493 TaxID=579490 RepID=UPI0005FA276A
MIRAPSGFAALITAAGRGTRAGNGLPKQWRDLAGRPVLDRTLTAFAGFERIVLVVHPDDMGQAIARYAGGITIVAGAETRAASVRAGLTALQGQASHVLIHDGARPLVAPSVIDDVIRALQEGADAAAPALPVSDALWRG